MGHWRWDIRCGTWDTGDGTLDVGHGTLDVGQEMWDTGCGTLSLGHGTLEVGHWTWDTLPGTWDTGRGTGEVGHCPGVPHIYPSAMNILFIFDHGQRTEDGRTNGKRGLNVTNTEATSIVTKKGQVENIKKHFMPR